MKFGPRKYVGATVDDGKIVVAKDLDHRFRKQYARIPLKEYLMLLKSNHNLYEVIQGKTKLYLDIDDTSSSSEDDARLRLNTFVSHYFAYLGIKSQPCVLSSHGTPRGKTAHKWSFTVISPDHYFESNAHQKVALSRFVRKAPEHRKYVDTAVYSKFQCYRALGQCKFADPRPNILETDHDPEDTVLSLIKRETMTLLKVSLLSVPKSGRRARAVPSGKPGLKKKKLPKEQEKAIQKLIDDLPGHLAEEYNDWLYTATFIKSVGGTESHLMKFSAKRPSKVSGDNGRIWRVLDAGFATPSRFYTFLRRRVMRAPSGRSEANRRRLLQTLYQDIVALQPAFNALENWRDVSWKSKFRIRKTKQRYVTLLDKDLSQCLLVESPPGSGKTTSVARLVSEYHRTTPMLLITSRQTLCGQLITSFKKQGIRIQNYQDVDPRLYDTTGRLAIQLDSIVHMSKQAMVNRLLIIDEVYSLLNYLALSTTLGARRRAVFYHFLHALRSAQLVVLMDATLSRHTLELVATLARETTLIRNTWPVLPGVKVGITTNRNYFDVHLRKMIALPKWIVTDSKSQSKLIGAEIELDGRSKVHYFNADECDRHILANLALIKGDTIICSPKITYGVDQNTPSKCPTFGLYENGFLPPMAIYQQIMRNRNPSEILICMNDNPRLRQYDSPEAVLERTRHLYERNHMLPNFKDYIREDETEPSLPGTVTEQESVLSYVDKLFLRHEDDHIFDRLYSAAVYYQLWQQSDPVRHLVHILQSKGVHVERVGEEEHTKSKRKGFISQEARKTVKNQEEEYITWLLSLEKDSLVPKKYEKRLPDLLRKMEVLGFIGNRELSIHDRVTSEIAVSVREVIADRKRRLILLNDRNFRKYHLLNLVQENSKEELMNMMRSQEFKSAALKTKTMMALVLHKLVARLELGTDPLRLPDADTVRKRAGTQLKEALSHLEAKEMNKLFRLERQKVQFGAGDSWLDLYHVYVKILSKRCGMNLRSGRRLKIDGGMRIQVFENVCE